MSRTRMQNDGAISRVRALSLLKTFLDGRENRQSPEIPESSNRPVPGPVTNYRRLLRRYIQWVKISNFNVDYINTETSEYPPGRHFSHEEWEILKELSNENRKTTNKTINVEGSSNLPRNNPVNESAETLPET